MFAKPFPGTARKRIKAKTAKALPRTEVAPGAGACAESSDANRLPTLLLVTLAEELADRRE
jgi:hypothetical protein